MMAIIGSSSPPEFTDTMRYRYNAVNFLGNIHKRRASYGVSIVDPASDWYSAAVSVFM